MKGTTMKGHVEKLQIHHATKSRRLLPSRGHAVVRSLAIAPLLALAS
jgi:hypothetical protein